MSLLRKSPVLNSRLCVQVSLCRECRQRDDSVHSGPTVGADSHVYCHILTCTASVYAMACLDAYIAYGGDDLLAKAQILWEDLSSDLIIPANIASGVHNGTHFKTNCGGGTSRSLHDIVLGDQMNA